MSQVLTIGDLKEIDLTISKILAEIGWRRDLTPFEKKVQFEDIKKELDTFENKWADTLGSIMGDMISAVLNKVEEILKKEKYHLLKRIQVPYQLKYKLAIDKMLKELCIYGLKQVKKELKRPEWIPLPKSVTAWIDAKAEAITTSHVGRLKSEVILTTLAGLRAGKTVKQIIWDLSHGVE